jgi:hypothetical protein
MNEQPDDADLSRNGCLCFARRRSVSLGFGGACYGREPAITPRAAGCCISPGVPQSMQLEAACAGPECSARRSSSVLEGDQVLAEIRTAGVSKRPSADDFAGVPQSNGGRTRHRAAAAAQMRASGASDLRGLVTTAFLSAGAGRATAMATTRHRDREAGAGGRRATPKNTCPTGAGSAPPASPIRARRQDAGLPYARQTTSLYRAEEQFRCLTKNSCRN